MTLLANGSRVVEGDYAELVYSTVVPCRWWRDTARRVAEQIVQEVGGLAWDNQGSIHLIVPLEAALAAAGIMQASAGDDLRYEDRVTVARGATSQEGRLLRAGLLKVSVGKEGNLLLGVASPMPAWKKTEAETAEAEATV